MQRIMVAEKYRAVISRRARENQLSGRANQDVVCPISNKREKIDTQKELSQIAKVGKDTYWKGKKILESDNEEVKQKAISDLL